MRHDTAVLDFINSLAADVEDVTQLGLRDVSFPAQGFEAFGNRGFSFRRGPGAKETAQRILPSASRFDKANSVQVLSQLSTLPA